MVFYICRKSYLDPRNLDEARVVTAWLADTVCTLLQEEEYMDKPRIVLLGQCMLLGSCKIQYVLLMILGLYSADLGCRGHIFSDYSWGHRGTSLRNS